MNNSTLFQAEEKTTDPDQDISQPASFEETNTGHPSHWYTAQIFHKSLHRQSVNYPENRFIFHHRILA